MVVRQRSRARLSPSSLGLTRAWKNPRPTGAGFPVAQRPARSPPPTMGSAHCRRSSGRPLRGLHEIPPLPDGWCIGTAADATCLRLSSARVPWSLAPRKSKAGKKPSSLLERASGAAGSAFALAPSSLRLARAALLEQQLTLPFRAPRTMFNVRIGGARRVAAQSWSLERIKAVKEAAGVTVNDVVLAMSSGALRSYLLDQNALPDDPLTAMVPVNLRKDGDDSGGNMVGAFLCNLATDLDDPAQRLDRICT